MLFIEGGAQPELTCVWAMWKRELVVTATSQLDGGAGQPSERIWGSGLVIVSPDLCMVEVEFRGLG